MSYLIDVNEELDEQVQEQIRKFKRQYTYRSGITMDSWYRINNAMAAVHDRDVVHVDVRRLIDPELFNDRLDAIYMYHIRDVQRKQVGMLCRNLKACKVWSRRRGKMSNRRLKFILMEILEQRIDRYINPEKYMEKFKILCIIGESGCGKTLASLHLKNHMDANVICSFTTRPPRSTEVEGREHHFIDIVPDRTELLAYCHFGAYYYYALKTQVFGPCTVYVIDEKGLANLRQDCGDEYDIYTIYITRDEKLRRKCGITKARMKRDKSRVLNPDDYDYVVENNGSKKEFFRKIEAIYEEVKNK